MSVPGSPPSAKLRGLPPDVPDTPRTVLPPERPRGPIFAAGLLLAAVAFAVGGLLWADRVSARRASAVAPCVEVVRLVTFHDEGWTSCPHPQHKMVDGYVGNGVAKVACVCVRPGEPWDGVIEKPTEPDAGAPDGGP